MTYLRNFQKNESGAVSVEAAFISTIMVALTIGAFEICYGFFQWNTAQQAARVGARIAATSPPVSSQLQTLTGLENGGQPGQAMPDYVFNCSGATSNCSNGGFNQVVFNEIVFGPDRDDSCGATTRARRGMCDLFSRVTPQNVEVEYRNSGLGQAGTPALIAPLITVTLKDVEFDFAILRYFTPKKVRTMPDVKVTVVAEDMRSGA